METQVHSGSTDDIPDITIKDTNAKLLLLENTIKVTIFITCKSNRYRVSELVIENY
jgi:hypothetical protein